MVIIEIVNTAEFTNSLSDKNILIVTNLLHERSSWLISEQLGQFCGCCNVYNSMFDYIAANACMPNTRD